MIVISELRVHCAKELQRTSKDPSSIGVREPSQPPSHEQASRQVQSSIRQSSFQSIEISLGEPAESSHPGMIGDADVLKNGQHVGTKSMLREKRFNCTALRPRCNKYFWRPLRGSAV